MTSVAGRVPGNIRTSKTKVCAYLCGSITRYSPATEEFSRMLQLLTILQFTNLELTLQCVVLWDPIKLHYNSSVICFLDLCTANKSNNKLVF